MPKAKRASILFFNNMNEILKSFAPITLAEMKDIRLMNRTDTKFVTTKEKLRQLLELAQEEYYVQEIDGRRIGDYYTMYFDTPDYGMFRVHHCGHANRQKLRIRSYVESKQNFLEVKTKNNHKRTKKKRMTFTDFDPANPRHDIRFGLTDGSTADYDAFLTERLFYDKDTLSPGIENRFHRITLVNKGKTERLTIDLDLYFRNLKTGQEHQFQKVVIIELKRDGLVPSPILPLLNKLRIKTMGFSKYCIGTAITNPALPQNRFKKRIRAINKLEIKSDNITTTNH